MLPPSWDKSHWENRHFNSDSYALNGKAAKDTPHMSEDRIGKAPWEALWIQSAAWGQGVPGLGRRGFFARILCNNYLHGEKSRKTLGCGKMWIFYLVYLGPELVIYFKEHTNHSEHTPTLDNASLIYLLN